MKSLQAIRRACGILFVLALVLSTAACRGRVTPTPEPRTIQFILYNQPGELRSPYQRLADEFQAEHPEITVEIRSISGSGSLRSALNAGADVVLSWGWALQDVGELRPLDPFIEAESPDFLNDYLPRVLDAVRYQGQILALPVDLDVLVLYYNKELFDQAGVPYPEPGWTWSDFVALAQALTQPLPDGNVQYGFYPAGALPDYLPFVAQELSALWGDDLLNPQKLRLDSEPVIRAVEWFTDLALRYGVMPTPAELRRSTGDPIVLGRAAMWLDWMSERGGRWDSVPWQFSWGVAPLPRGSTGRTIVIMAMYVIPTSANHPEDAWRWITFLSRRYEQNSGLPVRRSLLEDPDLQKQIGPEHFEVFVKAAMDGIIASPGPEFDIYASALERAVREILVDGRPVEEALRDAQRRVDAAGG
ncbi:MAG TPA: sugar ABC transporter substrate-binding protein [Caldilineae bacterium]|nr:sugar ABC transporter substrate-binding protein [Caldilineae bacterium]